MMGTKHVPFPVHGVLYETPFWLPGKSTQYRQVHGVFVCWEGKMTLGRQNARRPPGSFHIHKTPLEIPGAMTGDLHFL